uniref:Putative secreted protein n=1 Tax=Ixodes ricinus TaxID=34613 RepID=A0A6B0TQX2_IXORI
MRRLVILSRFCTSGLCGLSMGMCGGSTRKITSPPLEGSTPEYCVSHVTSVMLRRGPVGTPGKLSAQS